MHKNLRPTVRTTTFGNVLQRTENDIKPLITVRLTTFNTYQRVSTNVKISPRAKRTLSQFVIVLRRLKNWIVYHIFCLPPMCYKIKQSKSTIFDYTRCFTYFLNTKRAATCDFQQYGMCDQQRLRTACAYAQSDQSLC